MTHTNPLFADLKAKFAEANNERHTAKKEKELADKKIADAEARMRKFTDLWTALKAVYPDMPELDTREKGSFSNGNEEEDLTTAKVKKLIIQTVTAVGHFTSKSEIEDKMLLDFAMMGLRKLHLIRLSQFLKHLKLAGRLIRAKGDDNNSNTYWGLPEFVVHKGNGASAFVNGKEPKTKKTIIKWDFQSGRGADDDDPE